MPRSLHSTTVPAMLTLMQSLAGLLDKAEAHCHANGLPDSALTQAKLADDMWPLARQVRACCAHSAGALDALDSGETGPDFSEPPYDFATLKALVADALVKLHAADADGLEHCAQGDVCFAVGDRRMEFVAEDYLTTFAMPNLYFHAAMAYAILRNQGVDIGKRDFLGGLKLKG